MRPFVFLWSNISNTFCTSCQLNQHLQDSLCQQLLQLDEVSIQSPSASIREGEEEGKEEEDGDGDMEQQVDHPIQIPKKKEKKNKTQKCC